MPVSGYACLTIGVPGTGLRSLQQKNADRQTLMSVTEHNLRALDRMLDYNLLEGIGLFRISSDIIPFASSPVNDLPWWSIYGAQMRQLGQKISSAIRVSMHPGQYTVLNSLNADVVQRAVLDLEYHTRFLDNLETSYASKIVLHIGGLFADRSKSMDRFCANYQKLDMRIKRRLVIENDERLFNIGDALAINSRIGVPVVFDNLHHQLNPPESERTVAEWISLCRATWGRQDGRQKIHYSQQAPGKKPGAHSESISARRFLEDITVLDRDLDIMLEVKDKNLSAVKCINLLKEKGKIADLEREWQKYKYEVLAKSPTIYREIRELLKDKNSYPAFEFYQLLEKAAANTIEPGHVINAAQHVWGYCKKQATEQEKKQFTSRLERYAAGRLSDRALKMFLWRLAEKYDQKYLLQSLFLSRVGC